MDNKHFLYQLFTQAVSASLPRACLTPHLNTLSIQDKVCVLGAGKASVEMAQVMVDYFGDCCYGAVVCRHGYSEHDNIGNVKILKGGHPLPDKYSMQAATQILSIAKAADSNTPVIFLLSGGGSALLSLPRQGISLNDKVAINQFLLSCGAPINEINTVRMHLSDIKGGKLAQAITGSSHTFVISDVVGDNPHIIASGPTLPSESTPIDALAILDKYQWTPMPQVIAALTQHNASNDRNNKRDEAATRHRLSIIANAKQAIDHAISTIDTTHYYIEIIDYELTGDANTIANKHAQLAIAAKRNDKPTLLISGGELTVTLDNNATGDGGPNQHYLLCLAKALNGEEGICALACDTDGIDGSVDVAGAFIDESTLKRAKSHNLDIKNAIATFDSYRVFNALNDLIITGPTHTNVNDFRAIMITPQ